MYNLLKKIILLILLFLGIHSVSADTCEYPDADISIKYDENNNKVVVDYDKFKNGEYFVNLKGIIKWGQESYVSEEIIVDQTVYKENLGNIACPTNMYVCEVSDWSLKTASVKNYYSSVEKIFTDVPCFLGTVSKDKCDDINKNLHAIIHFNEKKLYIVNEEEYKRLKLDMYEGGHFSSEYFDGYTEGFEKCNSDIGGGIFGIIAGHYCGNWFTIFSIGEEIAFKDGVDVIYYKESECNLVKSDSDFTFDINCGKLGENKLRYKTYVERYKNCDGDSGCELSVINGLNETENELKNQCLSILSNYDFNELQKNCILSCLSLKDDLEEYTKGTDLYKNLAAGGHCGVSERLILFVANIVKWVKYIVPVIVIVLGILDFIKAIASGKDDEMKKVQGSFVKRLIAAALIFIIPFIIEFILNVMNFDVNGCGIIDL